MAIEDVVLWTAFIGGVLGAISFFWQAYNHYLAREESMSRTLNAKVLRPWSDLTIRQKWEQGRANVIALVIPKEALPSDVVPTAGQEGLEVQELPGLERGVAFLRKRHPTVEERWQKVKELWERYEVLLARRRAAVEPWIRQQMEREFPGLKPARFGWTEKNTYVLDNILAFTESRGWDAAARGEAARPIQVTKSPTQSGDTVYYEVRGDDYGTMIHTYTESIADADAMKKVIVSSLQRPEVREVNKDLVACFAELERAIETFRVSLREVAVAVDVSGG